MHACNQDGEGICAPYPQMGTSLYNCASQNTVLLLWSVEASHYDADCESEAAWMPLMTLCIILWAQFSTDTPPQQCLTSKQAKHADHCVQNDLGFADRRRAMRS